MTEQEWLECANPYNMLEFLRHRASERKLRLFEVACCRRVWQLLEDRRICVAVEAGEQYADGTITGEELDEAAQEAVALPWRPAESPPSPTPAHQADAGQLIEGIGYTLGVACAEGEDPSEEQCVLLREVIGNPFRLTAVDPAWLRWKGGSIPKMAGAIYGERRFDDLPILADALEDAGCTDASMLEHLRGPGPHVRGCWAVDALLGKK